MVQDCERRAKQSKDELSLVLTERDQLQGEMEQMSQEVDR